MARCRHWYHWGWKGFGCQKGQFVISQAVFIFVRSPIHDRLSTSVRRDYGFRLHRYPRWVDQRNADRYWFFRMCDARWCFSRDVSIYQWTKLCSQTHAYPFSQWIKTNRDLCYWCSHATWDRVAVYLVTYRRRQFWWKRLCVFNCNPRGCWFHRERCLFMV